MGRKRYIWSWLLVAALVLGITAAMVSTGAAQQQPQPATQGDFAVQLAASLGLGTGLTAEQAVSALTAAGIEPFGGWDIAAPVTAEVTASIQSAVTTAAAAGRISVTPADAATIVGNVAAQEGVAPPPGAPATAGEGGTGLEGGPVGPAAPGPIGPSTGGNTSGGGGGDGGNPPSPSF